MKRNTRKNSPSPADVWSYRAIINDYYYWQQQEAEIHAPKPDQADEKVTDGEADIVEEVYHHLLDSIENK